MKSFLICLLFISTGLDASKGGFQTEFPTVYKYLDKYGKNLEESSDILCIKTLPYSGTNITIALLNHLTGKNCLWDRGLSWQRGVVLNRAFSRTDADLFPILGSHNAHDFKGLEDNILICTVRDYREWFSKQYRHFDDIKSHDLQMYLNHLQFFDEWNSEKKLMIRFEELLEHPDKVVCKLANFFQVSGDRVQELFDEYEDFSRKVFSSYKRQIGTRNDSLKTNFHRKRFSANEIQMLEDRLHDLNPDLFEKYLSDYNP